LQGTQCDESSYVGEDCVHRICGLTIGRSAARAGERSE
jgi:hypothetical protein